MEKLMISNSKKSNLVNVGRPDEETRFECDLTSLRPSQFHGHLEIKMHWSVEENVSVPNVKPRGSNISGVWDRNIILYTAIHEAGVALKGYSEDHCTNECQYSQACKQLKICSGCTIHEQTIVGVQSKVISYQWIIFFKTGIWRTAPNSHHLLDNPV